MVGRRVLIEERRQVLHPTCPMEPSVPIHRSNLWTKPAHNEVFEDPSHSSPGVFPVGVLSNNYDVWIIEPSSVVEHRRSLPCCTGLSRCRVLWRQMSPLCSSVNSMFSRSDYSSQCNNTPNFDCYLRLIFSQLIAVVVLLSLLIPLAIGSWGWMDWCVELRILIMRKEGC